MEKPRPIEVILTAKILRDCDPQTAQPLDAFYVCAAKGLLFAGAVLDAEIRLLETTNITKPATAQEVP